MSKILSVRHTRYWSNNIIILQEELQVCLSHEAEAQELKPFLLLPLTVVHVINEQSPLYNVAGKDLEFADFELVAVLEGVVESTGMVTQAKMSYLPHEILWGHRFCSLSFINQGHSKKCEKRTKFDISQLDMTHEVSCPLCSANEYYEFRQSCSANRSRPESAEHRIWIPMEEYDMLWAFVMTFSSQILWNHWFDAHIFSLYTNHSWYLMIPNDT